MQYTTEITTVFNCSLERAFKTPMLSDVCKVHTGHGIMPRVTHCTDDQNWGKIGGGRKVFMPKTLLFKGGEAALDTVIERKENEYWKIRIDQLKYRTMGITAFEGEWFTRSLSPEQTEIRYRYTIYGKSPLLTPFHWYFTKIIWRNYMKHAMENIRKMTINKEPYLFE